MSAPKLAAQNRCLPFAHLLGLGERHNKVAGLAASIIHAGKVRRREIAEKSELHPIAAAIIAAAKKARG